MARPHAASLIEDAFHRRSNALLRARGWRTRTISHTGYGSQGFVRVLGRVLLSRPVEKPAASEADSVVRELRGTRDEQRGWRAFVTAGAMDVPVSVTVRGRTTHAHTDRSGYLDVVIQEPGFDPGWHTVTIEAEGAKPVPAWVLIIDRQASFGLVSDIDDTVILHLAPPSTDRSLEHVRASGNRAPPGARHGADVSHAARRTPRFSDLLPVHRRLEHRANPDPLPQAPRLSSLARC